MIVTGYYTQSKILRTMLMWMFIMFFVRACTCSRHKCTYKVTKCILQTEKDLENEKLQARQARKEEHCDCMAAVILGSFELSEEEIKYTEALEEKYDALRTVMLRHCLKLEVGLAWERFDKCLS